jgi:antitoxin (DNA-binding transcriptional repressor) of toxin-antitoxin stability system
VKKVGIKTLKNELSKYIHLVREGEVVYVTDRDAVVAEIRRPVRKEKPRSRWEEFLEREEKAGRIIRAKSKRTPLSEILKDMPPLPAGVDLLKTLEDVRGENRY